MVKIDKLIEKINYYMVYVMILCPPLFFFFTDLLPHFCKVKLPIESYEVFYLFLPIQIIIYIYFLVRKKNKIKFWDLLIFLMILFGIISTIFAIIPDTSLHGSIFRKEGLIHFVSYYFFFLNSRHLNKKETIVKIINLFIVIGLLQTVYSFLQVFIRGPYIFVKHEVVSYRASGFLMHPNLLGSYIILVMFLALGMYFLQDENKKFYLWSSIILYINLILTESTGPFYAYCVTLLFMFIFLKIKKKINWKQIGVTIALSIVLLFSVSSANAFVSKHLFFEEFKYRYSIISDIQGNFSFVTNFLSSNKRDEIFEKNELGVSKFDELGSYRMWIWKRSMLLVPKYLWTGAGIDNFSYAFKEVDDRHVAIFDRAHNEYLHLLITQGVFAFITYLILLLLVFIKGIKSKNWLVWILLFSFVGYSVQIVVNINYFFMAPFYYIVMGLLVGLEEYSQHEEIEF